jgi:hypothetical protein
MACVLPEMVDRASSLVPGDRRRALPMVAAQRSVIEMSQNHILRFGAMRQGKDHS